MSESNFVRNNATPAEKHDAGKLRYDLLPWEALEDVTRVMMFGAGKYGEDNWRKGLSRPRLFSAALRHLTAWLKDPKTPDAESGLPHLAHAACCVLFALTYEAGDA